MSQQVVHSEDAGMGDPELAKLADTTKLMRLALLVLGVGFGGFLLWAALVPLDEGVPTMGNVVIDTKRRPVQHAEGGTVAEILVREGDFVKEGQLLLRLGESTARSQVETAQSALMALRENLKGQQAMVTGIAKLIPSRESQLELLRREYAGLQALVKDGYAPVNQKLEMERRLSELESSLQELATQKIRSEQSVLQLGHEIQAAEERLFLARKELERKRVYSPADGQVVGLEVGSAGAVIQSAQKIMDIVPARETLVIEAQVMPNLIDRIRPGDSVDIMFMTFSHSPQLVVDGVLDSVSQDVLTDPKTGLTYYLARVSVTASGLAILGGRQMQPGMPVQVVVKTGARTLLDYLTAPLTRRINASMREE